MSTTISNIKDYQSITIQKVLTETEDVKTLILKPENDLVYASGQFLTFVFEDINGNEERRSYSFSSSPNIDKFIAITIKRIPNGKYSRPLTDKIKEGNVLYLTNVSGQFTLPQNIEAYTQLFFFAAGIGITPIFSLIKTILHTQEHTEVILIYSNQSQEQTVFYDALLQLHYQFPKRLKLEFLYSSAVNLNRARLSKWLLPQLLNNYPNSDKKHQLFYTCGPFDYMRMVTLSLEEAGYNKNQIKKENFDTSLPVVKTMPDDTSTHHVHLDIKGNQYDFKVAYPNTILQIAKKLHIPIPYSCETGKCGSCVMTCTKGKVWMSYNEVLTDKEIEAGKILTCVGHPINGDVKLKLP